MWGKGDNDKVTFGIVAGTEAQLERGPIKTLQSSFFILSALFQNEFFYSEGVW